MAKRFLIVIILAVLVIGGLAYFKFSSIQAQMKQVFVPPPDTVTTVIATPGDWAPALTAIGSFKPVEGVEVSTDLSGMVSKIGFESGKPVKKGDLLVQLDTTQEEAALRSAQARSDLANLNRERFQELFAKKSASKSDLDNVIAECRQAQAAVDEQKALISRKTICAPFDGQAGIRKINLGQYINPGTPLVDVTHLDPIYVNFSLPQQYVPDLAPGREVSVVVENVDTDTFKGAITALNSVVDPATRNIEVQATLANPEGNLLPGMFGKISVALPQKEKVIAIPGSAISYAPYGNSVFVVVDGKGPDGKSGKVLAQKNVQLGDTRGDQVAIVSGLDPGDEVVSSGVFKLRPGSSAVVNNAIQPGNNPAPKPNDN